VKDSQSKILDVAARLFAERGYSNVSVRDVCREAATTTPMIYYYFGNKRGLFTAAVSHKISMREFINRLKEKSGGENEEEGISAFIDTYLSAFPDRVFDMGLYMLDTAKLDRKSAERISKDLDEVHMVATSIIERGVKSARFRTTDSSRAADCLIGMLNRVIFQRIHFAKALNIRSSRAFITDFFLKAMKQPSAGSAKN
jgi:AcrR family transcriptional regulator